MFQESLTQWLICCLDGLLHVNKIQQLVHPVTWITVNDCTPAETYLTKIATSRLSNAFTNSTKRAYATLFSTFLAFTVFMGWILSQVNVFNLLCFLECLHYNGVKHSQMANYWSAIKSKFLIFGLNVACFTDHRLKYYQRAVQLHAPLQVKLNIINVDLLKRIVLHCDLTYMGQIFKTVYLLSFFSFL